MYNIYIYIYIYIYIFICIYMLTILDTCIFYQNKDIEKSFANGL